MSPFLLSAVYIVMQNNIHIGVVISTEDDYKRGRVKIRLTHIHDDISDDDLPFAIQMMPTTSSSLKSKGLSPTFLEKGTNIVCIPTDEELQSFIIIGTFHTDNNDINKLAQEEQTDYIKKRNSSAIKRIKHFTGVWKEKLSKYKAKYPYNKVFKSSSGHVIEIDDTKDNERIVVYHNSGSYIELNKDREVNIKTGDLQTITDGNSQQYTKGNITLSVDGDVNLDLGGDLSIKTKKNLLLEANKIELVSKTDIKMKANNNIMHTANQVHYD